MKFATPPRLFLILMLFFPLVVHAAEYQPDWFYVRLQAANAELDAEAAIAAIADFPSVTQVAPAAPPRATQLEPSLGLWKKVWLTSGSNRDAILAQIRALPGVDYAEPPVPRQICELPGSGREITDRPNDPLLSFQWHLEQVNAFAAWDEGPSAEGVVIAILDNGIDVDHPDLQPVLWRNQAELTGDSGFDDDANGWVDDFYGWDAYALDGNPDAPEDVDSPGHGTHCAGIAAAVNDNGIGGSGLARGATIMAVRIGEGRNIYNTVDGIIYASLNGADVISMSFAGPLESVFERDIIKFAVNQGITVIAAAGNETSTTLSYPAAYDNVLAVAATDLDNNLADFSNYGWWIQAAAPGVDILSTFINGYGYSSGTSMAAPLVAGLAALVEAAFPGSTQDEVLARIQEGSQALENSADLATPAGVIDAWRSLLPDRPVVLYHTLGVDVGGDRRMAIGESANVGFNLELMGTPAHQLTVSLVPLINNIVRTGGFYSATDQQPGLFTATYTVRSENWCPQGDQQAALYIKADEWRDTLSVRIPVDPPWVTIQGGQMRASVSDFGAIGYRDYVGNKARPDGVRIVDDRIGELYHGSLMIGDVSGVSDNAYGNDSQAQYDFEVRDGHHFAKLSTPSDRTSWQCEFTDIYTPGVPVGVFVTQTATAYQDGGNILYVDYAVRRQSGIGDLYVGMYCDWDILDLGLNTVFYNSDLRLSYMMGSDSFGNVRYAGVVALGGTPVTGVRAINNPVVLNNGFLDNTKMAMMSGGVGDATSNTVSDWSHLIAVLLDDVGSAAPRTASFAIIAAKTESELLQFAQEALDLSGTQTDPGGGNVVAEGPPTMFRLSPAWPNPFNASTRLTLNLNAGAEVDLVVYDLLGRRVTTLQRGRVPAGENEITWDGLTAEGIPAAAGTYFIEASAGDLHSRQKIVLVK